MNRLVPAVERALAEAAERVARRNAERRLRESEERFRLLGSVLTDVPWTSDADIRFVEPQPAWSAYTGQTRMKYRVRQLPATDGGRIPAVALTAFAREEDRQKALQAGYQRHLTKPIDRAGFLSVVASLSAARADIVG